MSIPSWVPNAIFYQIFPDRFMNGNRDNDPPHALPWNSCATLTGFMGGDLAGITQRLDYLLDLGINAIYLNPIFLSPSNHRYNTVDYYTIDPKLGSMADFRALVDAAHRNGIRVILDGVFNHCGRGFFAFNDILENGHDSPYLDWFHIKKFPLDAYTPGDAKNYTAWWGFKSLPKFNSGNPRVRKYLLDVSRYWIEQGADGWRLDVPNEIDDDDFWAEFRGIVRAANPEAYLVGEIWEALPRWANDTHFDGLMNYPVRTAVLGLLAGHWTPGRFLHVLQEVVQTYPFENMLAMFSLLGSHDVERVMTMLNGDIRKVKLALLFQFAFLGAPSIYYGDEIGLEGGKDPACRIGFPWDPAYWNQDLRAWCQKIISIRKAAPVLRHGAFVPLFADDAAGLVAYAREHEDQRATIILNASEHPYHGRVGASSHADGETLRDLVSGRMLTVGQGIVDISLDPYSGAILTNL